MQLCNSAQLCKIVRKIDASAQAPCDPCDPCDPCACDPPDPRVSFTSLWCRRCFSTVSSVPASVARWMDRMAAFSIRSSVWTLCISLSSQLCAICPIMSCPHVYVITISSLCHHYVIITTLSICCRYVTISSLYHPSISDGNETSYNFIKYTESAKSEFVLHYIPTCFNTFQYVRPIADASWRHQYYNDMHMYAYCTEIRYHIIRIFIYDINIYMVIECNK